MSAYGAYGRSLLAHYEMSAVAALPHGLLALFKYLLHLNVVKKSAVSFLVRLLDSRYSSELISNCLKALFLSFLSKGVVHVCPLVVFTCCRSRKVLSCVSKLS